MKIIVVSDTHGSTDFLDILPLKHQDADLFLHAGDSMLTEEELFPFHSVKGNCDYVIKNRYKKIINGNIKILMFHGNNFLLEENMLVNYAKEEGVNIIIHGHTHIPYYKYTSGVHILCPGSLVFPRVSRATYAIITLNDNENIDKLKVEIVNYENR